MKEIKKYEITIDYHLKQLKRAILSHYKDVNLNQMNFTLMDEIQIEKIIEAIKILIHQCKEEEKINV